MRSAASECAEDPVPAHQRLERPRAVEVEEVDVGHRAVAEQLGEVEHEALFHRPAREAVEAAEGDGDEHEHDRDAGPRAGGAGGPAAEPAPPAQHEGGGVVVDGGGGRRRRRCRRSLLGDVHGVDNLVAVPRGTRSPGIRSPSRDRPAGGAAGPLGPRSMGSGGCGAPRRGARRRAPAAGRRRRAGERSLAPGARPGHDRVPRPGRVHEPHAADRPARPDRHLPEPGQPPRPAQLLPAGPDLPAARADVLVARGRHRRRAPGRHRDGSLDRLAARRLAGRGRRRRAARPRHQGLRAGRAHPAVEPVPARSSRGSSCSWRPGPCCAATT